MPLACRDRHECGQGETPLHERGAKPNMKEGSGSISLNTLTSEKSVIIPLLR